MTARRIDVARTSTAEPEATTRGAPTGESGGWLAAGLVLLGLGAAAVAFLGPLLADVIRYHVSEGAMNQIVGGDVAGLVLVAPVSLLAGALVWKGHRAGPILALGPAVYGLYMYFQLSLGGDVLSYPGNSERFFPLFLGLFVLAGAILVRAWSSIDFVALPAPRPKVRRGLGAFLLIVSVFLTVGLHLPGLIDAWADQPTSPEYLADPVVFWLVKFMDLGVVVPLLILTGMGLLRSRDWATRMAYGAVGWTALLGSSVAGMAIVMQATGDPAGSTANTVAFSTFAAIALWMAGTLYRPLFRSNTGVAPFVARRVCVMGNWRCCSRTVHRARIRVDGG